MSVTVDHHGSSPGSEDSARLSSYKFGLSESSSSVPGPRNVAVDRGVADPDKTLSEGPSVISPEKFLGATVGESVVNG